MKRSLAGRISIAAATTVLTLSAAACARTSPGEGTVRPKGESNAEAPIARQIAWLGDLHQPEGVRYDPEQDVFFMSNMVGFGSVKDANRYIVEVKASCGSFRPPSRRDKPGDVGQAPELRGTRLV
jgi:hypothetical protein